ncbi:MAG TPA: hypothetical protein VLM75_15300 [Spirochaetota bacterium]|nr:hypothetical protein [Spirochaetota bacterium]
MSRVFDFTRFQLDIFPDWERQFRSGGVAGEYSYKIGGPTDSYGSTDMLISRYIIGDLDLTEKQKDEWASVINRFQRPDGWYARTYTFHHREHTTAYAVAALRLIDRRPSWPLAWSSKILADRASMERWINGVNWSIIWPGSHVVSGVPAALAMTGEGADNFYDWYFDWLDRAADPKSGFWCRGLVHRLGLIRRPTKHEMGGAFHMYYVYEYFGRKWRHPEKVVDHTLRLQRANGLWDADVTYCIDLDGVYCLTRSSRNAGWYRKDDVYRACVRYLETAERILNDREFMFKRYRNSHILTGALGAVAECELFFPDTIRTACPWRQSLDKACFI